MEFPGIINFNMINKARQMAPSILEQRAYGSKFARCHLMSFFFEAKLI